MKSVVKISIVALIAVLLSSFMPIKDFTGTIVYNITYDMEDMDPQMAAYLPKTMKLTIKAPMSRSEIIMSMGTNISIFNSDDRTGITLMDMMGQKFAIKIKPEDMEKEMDEAGDIEVVKLDETKEILGYTCKKAIIKVKDGGPELTVYYTDELSTGLENANNPMFKDIDGMMLEFMMNQEGMNMHFTAVNIDKKKVSDSLFDIPDGYEEISSDEMQSRFGM